MPAKIRRLIGYIRKGELLAILYEQWVVYGITAWQGRLWLALYQWIFSGLTVDRGVQCWGRPLFRISPKASVSIGEDTRLNSHPLRSGIAIFSPTKITAFFESSIHIGRNVGMVGTSITCRTTSITVGDGSMIAPNVIIVDSDFHAIWPPQNRIFNMAYDSDRPVTIGRNVWVGMNSLILKGVNIGDNSVIAAGSIVVKDIPANVLAGGNPAQAIKQLG